MKFYKRLHLDSHNPQSNVFAVEQDGRAIIDTTQSLRLPAGTAEEQPLDASQGQIRQNTTLQELEALVKTTWERIRTVRPATITTQNLGSGNYYSNIFGPLNQDYQPSYDQGGAQNVMVYVDNVFQIPGTNYDLTNDPNPVNATTTATSTAGSTILQLDTVFNVQPGTEVTGDSAIPSGTIVLGTIANSFNINISQGLTGTLTTGTELTFTFNTGTYLQFSGPVPAKPVVAMLGYDGYFPPS
jgi:hypothetical protein